jgi:hypothetical protein
MWGDWMVDCEDKQIEFELYLCLYNQGFLSKDEFSLLKMCYKKLCGMEIK